MVKYHVGTRIPGLSGKRTTFEQFIFLQIPFLLFQLLLFLFLDMMFPFNMSL